VKSSDEKVPIDNMVKRHDGTTYVFAFHEDARRSELRGEGIREGEAELIGGDRKIKVNGGRFEETFRLRGQALQDREALEMLVLRKSRSDFIDEDWLDLKEKINGHRRRGQLIRIVDFRRKSLGSLKRIEPPSSSMNSDFNRGFLRKTEWISLC